MKKKSPENVALARRLRLEGKAYKEIARVFGVKPGTIFLWCLDDEEYKARCKRSNAKEGKKTSRYLYHAKKNALKAGIVPPDITVEEYEAMVKKHNGKCDICGSQPTDRLRLDHCHRTGRVRGLLCTACNTGIGLLKESTKVLTSAIKYIEKM